MPNDPLASILSPEERRTHQRLGRENGSSGRKRASETGINAVRVSVYRVPTDGHESDGTYQWDATTLVLVEITAADETGLGFTYADCATATLIHDSLAKVVTGHDPMHIPRAWIAMVQAIRNIGRPGVASMAISAVDNALWDLKARLLNTPLVSLLGPARDTLPVYGSGGFTSYTPDRLQEQLRGWVSQGIPRVKMKIGRNPDADAARVAAARQAIGDDAELFVDANGAYSRKQALQLAHAFQ
ncbi:MAG: enolase C-terminal domain-like protein, partial [Chthoniobacterales bacterium]